MEITKYYCNRCHKEVKTYKLLTLNLLLHGIYSPKQIVSDLCKECSKDFKKWFEQKGVK